MGWEERGTNRYYYKKEREGSKVKSVYVGSGEIAHMVSKLQSSSAELEKLMRAKTSIQDTELEQVEATLDRAIELTQLFTQAALLVGGFHTHHRQWRRKRMVLNVEKVITDKTEETRKTFRTLLDKTNKEHPNPKDVKALSDLLGGNRKLELWRDVVSAGHLAELRVIENARATEAVKECWKHRLQVLKRSGLGRGAFTGETLDPASCFVLAEAESRGIELFRHHVTVNYLDARYVLGETLECRAKTFQSSLRDSRSSPKTLTQHTSLAVQHSNQWRAASEPREVSI